MINRVKDFIEFLNEAKGVKKPKKSDAILDALLNTPEGIGYSKLTIWNYGKSNIEDSISFRHKGYLKEMLVNKFLVKNQLDSILVSQDT